MTRQLSPALHGVQAKPGQYMAPWPCDGTRNTPSNIDLLLWCVGEIHPGRWRVGKWEPASRFISRRARWSIRDASLYEEPTHWVQIGTVIPKSVDQDTPRDRDLLFSYQVGESTMFLIGKLQDLDKAWALLFWRELPQPPS